MSLDFTLAEAAFRLLLATAAGAVIGFDRGERGRSAGLRTTILVCAAACISMLLVNLLLGIQGRPETSFVKIDVMRLPLGVLSGMGFIGGGAILRRGDLAKGVTTAATLWFVTIMGLCLGCGQLVLGGMALAVGWVVLRVVKSLESGMVQEKHASLQILLPVGAASEEQVRQRLQQAGFQVMACALVMETELQVTRLHYRLKWRASVSDTFVPDVVLRLLQECAASKVRWLPAAR